MNPPHAHAGVRTIAQHFARARPVCYRTRESSKVSYGRSVEVTLGPDGSLQVADDVGDVIWRVTGATGLRFLLRQQTALIAPDCR